MPEITQENVRLFIPLKVSKICAEFCADEKISVAEAVGKFYKSKTLALLEREATKMWCEGWLAIYDSYMEETA